MRFINLLSQWTEIVISKFIAIFMAIITIALVIQVAVRYLTTTGASWPEELARFGMIWMVFSGASLATKYNTQIRITALEDIFPPIRKYLFVIQQIVSITYFLLIAYFGFQILSVVSVQTSSNMKFPMHYIYLCIPLSAIISIFWSVFYKHEKEES